MDALQETAIRLYEKKLSVKEISRSTKTSKQKVRRILITVGLWSNPLTDDSAEEQWWQQRGLNIS